jgi:ubiquinone/menaquinone biosynthesis C-methylase UbiE
MSKGDYSSYDGYYQKLFAEGKTQWGSVEAQDELFAFAQRIILPEQRVLLLGCGVGILAERLIDYNLECVGIDVSETALEKARERLKDHPNYRFEVADVCNLPESLGYFDVIFDEHCTHCIVLDDRKAMWQSFHARLKSNGCVGIKSMIGNPPREIARKPETMTYNETTGTVYYNGKPIRHVTSAENLEREARANGFDVAFAEINEFPETEDHLWMRLNLPTSLF